MRAAMRIRVLATVFGVEVHRIATNESPPDRKATGFAAAAAGALAGAWLGLHTTDGFLALATAIVGAVLGANLPLNGVDIVRDQQARPGPRTGGTATRPHAPAGSRASPAGVAGPSAPDPGPYHDRR